MATEYLTKGKIVESVNSLQIPKDELVIVGGAALQLYGLKRTRDIDVIVPMHTLIDRIERRAGGRSNRGGMHDILGREEITSEGVDFEVRSWKDFYESESVGTLSVLPAPNDKLYSVSFEELREEAVEIKGIPVASLERILEWKQALERPKDITDIARIQAYLAHEPAATA
jgi:hypothetical protein